MGRRAHAQSLVVWREPIPKTNFAFLFCAPPTPSKKHTQKQSPSPRKRCTKQWRWSAKTKLGRSPRRTMVRTTPVASVDPSRLTPLICDLPVPAPCDGKQGLAAPRLLKGSQHHVASSRKLGPTCNFALRCGCCGVWSFREINTRRRRRY